MGDEELPLITEQKPNEGDLAEYLEVSSGVWLLQGLYTDVAEPDATVAVTRFDGDRPGGADGAWLDRHGDHYVFTSTWTDGPTYLGSFPTLAAAVEAWRAEVIPPGSSIEIELLAPEVQRAMPNDHVGGGVGTADE